VGESVLKTTTPVGGAFSAGEEARGEELPNSSGSGGSKTLEQANQYLEQDYLAWWERELPIYRGGLKWTDADDDRGEVARRRKFALYRETLRTTGW
jgi:hypothetical protein